MGNINAGPSQTDYILISGGVGRTPRQLLGIVLCRQISGLACQAPAAPCWGHSTAEEQCGPKGLRGKQKTVYLNVGELDMPGGHSDGDSQFDFLGH